MHYFCHKKVTLESLDYLEFCFLIVRVYFIKNLYGKVGEREELSWLKCILIVILILRCHI